MGVINGSTGAGRHGEAVAKLTFEIARKRIDASIELVDIATHNLPHLGETVPPWLN
jgi:hypothetical protein